MHAYVCVRTCVCVCVCVRERERECVCVCFSVFGSGCFCWFLFLCNFLVCLFAIFSLFDSISDVSGSNIKVKNVSKVP